MSLYYRIWVDCIIRAKQQPANKNNWKVGTLFYMTMAMSFDFILIMTILERHILKRTIYDIDFPFFPERANAALSFIFLFFLPCLVINYWFIFRNGRYQRLLEIYPYYNGKLFLTFFVISMMLPIVLLLIGFIFFR